MFGSGRILVGSSFYPHTRRQKTSLGESLAESHAYIIRSKTLGETLRDSFLYAGPLVISL